jgi:hypothetical protein
MDKIMNVCVGWKNKKGKVELLNTIRYVYDDKFSINDILNIANTHNNTREAKNYKSRCNYIETDFYIYEKDFYNVWREYIKSDIGNMNISNYSLSNIKILCDIILDIANNSIYNIPIEAYSKSKKHSDNYIYIYDGRNVVIERVPKRNNYDKYINKILDRLKDDIFLQSIGQSNIHPCVYTESYVCYRKHREWIKESTQNITTTDIYKLLVNI